MNYKMLKSIRKTWDFNPATQVHSTKKEYVRSANKEVKDDGEEYKSIQEQNKELDCLPAI